jgi:alpha-galactosidase
MTVIRWGHDALLVELVAEPDGPPQVRRWTTPALSTDFAPGQPAVEISTVRDGRSLSSQRLVRTAVGRQLRLVGHESAVEPGPTGRRHRLTVHLAGAGLAVDWQLTSHDGVPAATATTTVRNDGGAPLAVLAITSLVTRIPAAADDLDVVTGESAWVGEGRWRRRPLRDAAPDLSIASHGGESRGALVVAARGSWPTGDRIPVGLLAHRDGGPAWAWQVEHNGPWRWEVGDHVAGPYLALSGPTDIDHQFAVVLRPGEEFTTVPATLAAGSGIDDAVAALTAHRRASWRPHPDRDRRPVVFNDYMNTLMGDPTTDKLIPLVDAAADVGAEIFCIDAGWYDETGHWWDSVGEWVPSRTRFPGGIEKVLDHIRERGMVAGLWLEPEVVGVRSPVADTLPPEAFLRRFGERVRESDRYHLDLRHPAARAHLDTVVDRLVEELGVGYFKLDYNIDPGPGTDHDADAPGAGLLAHNRAQLAWVEGVLDRHPDLVLENCSSGAMRMDPATLARFQLQSTSDQQDPLRYPPIAVAAPLSMLPEQAANWAYPQPDMTDEEIAFTLCTSMLGRFYLSGRLDGMSDEQRALVTQAVTAHREIAPLIARATPSWPLGLPGWDDPWLALALDHPESLLLTLWRRPGSAALTHLDLPALRDHEVSVEPVFPLTLPNWAVSWDPACAALTVEAGATDTAARTLLLRRPTNSRPTSR